MKNIIISIVCVGLVVAGLIWLKSAEPTEAEIVAEKGQVISEQGLHWHPELKIFVKGQEIKIPENVGLGAVHNPVHTHEDMPIIHLEFPGLVRETETELGKFFEVWGKDFMELGATVTMTVNGNPNNELENYKMKDGDKIELRYE
jgi:hypothetical protein